MVPQSDVYGFPRSPKLCNDTRCARLVNIPCTTNPNQTCKDRTNLFPENDPRRCRSSVAIAVQREESTSYTKYQMRSCLNFDVNCHLVPSIPLQYVRVKAWIATPSDACKSSHSLISFLVRLSMYGSESSLIQLPRPSVLPRDGLAVGCCCTGSQTSKVLRALWACASVRIMDRKAETAGSI